MTSFQHRALTVITEKLLDTLCPEDFGGFVELLQPAVNQAKRTGCGKQLLSVEKKMHRLPPRWTGPPNGNAYHHGPYQLPLLTPPFSTRFNSAATTPPPLTADTQSLQSSNIPSINGDAIEGADRSRKGSGLAYDARYEHSVLIKPATTGDDTAYTRMYKSPK